MTGAAKRTLPVPGADLALSVFAADQPKAVILALHGFGDYGPNTFAGAGPYWAARGLTTYAPDQRGFGRNTGNAVWPGAGTLITDAAAMAQVVRARHPDLPLIVLGHSMGGGVALAAAGEGRLKADALALLAPAVWGGENLNILYRASAWFAALIAPDKRWTGRGVVTIRPSDNIEMLRALAGDPYHYANPSGREFLGLIRIMDRAVAAAPDVRAPVLVVMGAKDEIVPERPVRRVFDALQSPRDFAYVDTAWHMLLRDLEAERVWRIVADWALTQTRDTK